ncbi:MAG TPA: hypothetical protein VG871_03020 [Vicinamibacterales bacterium]|nr:hypothetical protein [Vicinamibacterales bacterium]
MAGKRALLVAAALSAALALVGCSQSDGPIPTPTDEQPNKVHDIGRDLQAIAGGEAAAQNDLLDDLNGIDGTDRPAPLVQNLSKALATALANKPLPDQVAQAAANKIFVVLTARQLSGKQITQVSADLKTEVAKAGVDASNGDRVASAATALQTAITRNKRRWYQFF